MTVMDNAYSGNLLPWQLEQFNGSSAGMITMILQYAEMVMTDDRI